MKERGWFAQQPNDWASGVLMQPLACFAQWCCVSLWCDALRCVRRADDVENWKFRKFRYFSSTHVIWLWPGRENCKHFTLDENEHARIHLDVCACNSRALEVFLLLEGVKTNFLFLFSILYFFHSSALLTANALNRTGRLLFMLLAWLLLSSFQHFQFSIYTATFFSCDFSSLLLPSRRRRWEIVSSRKKRIDEWKFFLHWDRKTSLIFNIRDFNQFLIDFHLFCSLKTLLFFLFEKPD